MKRSLCLAVCLAAAGLGSGAFAADFSDLRIAPFGAGASGNAAHGADGEVSYDTPSQRSRMMEIMEYAMRKKPPKPDMKGDWVDPQKDPITPFMGEMGDDYIPGHPGQTAYYPPTTDPMILEMDPARNRKYAGFYQAGYGHPVVYWGDPEPEAWKLTKEERLVRPHEPSLCEGMDESVRAAHMHLSLPESEVSSHQQPDGTWVVYRVDAESMQVQEVQRFASEPPAWAQQFQTPAAPAADAFLPSTNQPLENWNDAMNGEEHDAHATLRRALLLMGRGTLILGKALGKDTTDLTAAMNLVKQSDAVEGMTRLSRAISGLDYSSDDFLALARTSDAQKRKLKFALEKAEECKHLSNKLIVQGTFYALGNTYGTGGEYDGIIHELEAAYDAFTERTRTVKQLLRPEDIKEDSGKAEKLAQQSGDGLDF